MTPSLWFAFLLASIVIAVTPGPGAVTSMSTGIRHGYGHALRAIAGLQLALWIQLAIVVAGLGAVLAASETAFVTLKLAGAGYLVWLGVQKWRAPVVPLDQDLPPPAHGLFLQGLFVNLTNPKAIVFMAALVPQFIDPAGSPMLQLLILGGTMSGVDTIVMSAYALLAARCRPWFADARTLRQQNRFFGGLFVTAGGLLAASSKP